MASKNKYIVFAVIGIAAASGAAWWIQRPEQRTEAAAPGMGSAGGAANRAAGAGGGGAGRPVAVEAVAVRQNNILATSFHPELTPDTRMHSYFLSFCSK